MLGLPSEVPAPVKPETELPQIAKVRIIGTPSLNHFVSKTYFAGPVAPNIFIHSAELAAS